MHWRLKSAVQRFCGNLPVGSDTVYYFLQRTLGSFRHLPSPTPLLTEALSFAEWLRQEGISVKNLCTLEVGTGRRVDLPFGLFLLGASRTHTYDLNRYLKAELVEFSVESMRRERAMIENLFVSAADDPDDCRQRITRLLAARNAADAFRIAGIEYHAPADASRSGLEAGSIDLHYSYTVNEHIPAESLVRILQEARRVLSPSGVALHHVDPSDHFWHDDPSIPSIHFLQFTPRQWTRYGGNRFAYHNRLRAHEHAELFQRCGFEILRQQTWIDEQALGEIKRGFRLAAQFRSYSAEQLSSSAIRILARAGQTD